jgi:hypothetical protein
MTKFKADEQTFDKGRRLLLFVRSSAAHNILRIEVETVLEDRLPVFVIAAKAQWLVHAKLNNVDTGQYLNHPE